MFARQNKMVFDAFLDFPKPIIAAINGPAIGASVTTATLCDALLMAQGAATISTPFHRLGVPPEGCSSVRAYYWQVRASAQHVTQQLTLLVVLVSLARLNGVVPKRLPWLWRR